MAGKPITNDERAAIIATLQETESIEVDRIRAEQGLHIEDPTGGLP